MELILLRHTSVAVDPALIYGRTDVDVAPTFLDEAAAARNRLAAIWTNGPTHIVSSPATRCRLLAEQIGTIDRFDERLWEIGFGDWEMQRWDTVPRDELDRWSHDYVSVKPPGGESYGEVSHRVVCALSNIVNDADSDDRVLAVVHGGVIRAALANYLEIPLRRSFDVQIDYASITHITWRGHRPHLKLINHH